MQQINPKTGLPYKTTLAAREAVKVSKTKSKQTVIGKANILINNARTRSVKKNIVVEITQAWVEKHLKRGTCEITGMPFNLAPPPKGVTRRPDAPSLDRISKHKNYTEDNTRVILWAVNCALAEYGTDGMLPILKAMVKGIENAQALSATPLSAGNYIQGALGAELGSISTPWAWEDSDHSDDHSGAVRRQDADHSAKESGGDSVGQRSEEMGTPQSPESKQDNWQLHPTYGWIEC